MRNFNLLLINMKLDFLVISFKNMTIIMGIICIVCGILGYKYPNMLAGYNTLSQEKKEQINVCKLKKHFCAVCVFQGLLMIIAQVVLYSIHKESIADVLSYVWIPLFVIILIVMVNCGNYYQK